MSTTHLKDEENRGQTHPENDWWGVTANLRYGKDFWGEAAFTKSNLQ